MEGHVCLFMLFSFSSNKNTKSDPTLTIRLVVLEPILWNALL